MKRLRHITLLLTTALLLCSCLSTEEKIYTPGELLSSVNEWKITLGSGHTIKDLSIFQDINYFYTEKDSEDWIVYKTPNSGGTTKNSSNTRSELRHIPEWIPENGGILKGTLKVQHVSTTGDARVPAAFSVIVGQIHSSQGHENEPLKIFYKKYPGHTKGSLFWNYEINTKGNNNERWDYSTAVWGDDWSVLGKSPNEYPDEPSDGIELGEVFSYIIDVKDGIMHLTFSCDGHETKTFSKNLIDSDYKEKSDIPEQVLTIFASTNQDGVEKENAYSREYQYFKQGAYNQANGKDPSQHMVWATGAETYEGNLLKQYENGSYAEVWFLSSYVKLY